MRSINFLNCLVKEDQIDGCNNHASLSGKISRNVLYLTSFLTYGLCDSMSAAYMIMIRGVGAEQNQILRVIFIVGGAHGLIIFKALVTIVIIGAINLMCVKSKECMNWTVTGFLLSLTLGGILATLANLSKASGTPFTISSLDISLIFIASIAASIILGGILDAKHQNNITDLFDNINK